MRYYAPSPGGPSPGGGAPLRARGGPHALRIGDAERDAAAADLGEHYAAGRLTLDELHERLDAVFAAKTFGQLTRIMADLPGPARPSWRTANSSVAGFQTRGPQTAPTPSDRAGRVAALSLLLLAMLIWLFTALLFTRHGYYHPGPYSPYSPYGGPYGPSGPFSHFVPSGPGGP